MNKQINSSTIKSIEYNETRQDLKIVFKSGKEYVYTPVSKEFYNKLKNSTSKGSFFNLNIRDNKALTCMKVIE